MARLSIELTPDQHRRLKTAAALQRKSIRDYVIERVFNNPSDADASELEDFLASRVAEADRGEYVTKSVDEIFNDVLKEPK